jgi:hypothetical protein
MACAMFVGGLNGGRTNTDSAIEEFFLVGAFMAFPAVGALIASRQPRNAIGWLLLGIGLFVSLGVLGEEWAVYSFITSTTPKPFGTLGAWVATWSWIPLISTIPTLLLLLFPTGRLPSSHLVWRLTLWISALLVLTVSVMTALQETLDVNGLRVDNPVGISGIRDVEENIPFLVIAPLIALSVASLVVRFVRARGDERQQLKWVAFAAAVFAGGVMISEVFALPDILFPLVLATLPTAIAVAVLKYRLYDISVVINKTLVYGSLSAVLAAVYLGLVFVLREALPIGESELSVAASTLAVAALFGPLRRRLQGTIDHLFYRRKYDSAQTVAAFSASLRDEVDLNTLTSDLLVIVDETMRPAHASLWLRETAEPAAKRS